MERFQVKRPSIREDWNITNSLDFYEDPVFIKGYTEKQKQNIIDNEHRID